MVLVTCYSISINLCGREQDTYHRAICASMLSQVPVTHSVVRLTITLVLSTRCRGNQLSVIWLCEIMHFSTTRILQPRSLQTADKSRQQVTTKMSLSTQRPARHNK